MKEKVTYILDSKQIANISFIRWTLHRINKRHDTNQHSNTMNLSVYLYSTTANLNNKENKGCQS